MRRWNSPGRLKEPETQQNRSGKIEAGPGREEIRDPDDRRVGVIARRAADDGDGDSAHGAARLTICASGARQ
jgi:hypothetical protein